MKKTEVSFDRVLPIVLDWFGHFIGAEDCENIAQDIAIGMSEEKDLFDIVEQVCVDYHFDFDEFCGITSDLEELNY